MTGSCVAALVGIVGGGVQDGCHHARQGRFQCDCFSHVRRNDHPGYGGCGLHERHWRTCEHGQREGPCAGCPGGNGSNPSPADFRGGIKTIPSQSPGVRVSPCPSASRRGNALSCSLLPCLNLSLNRRGARFSGRLCFFRNEGESFLTAFLPRWRRRLR